MTGHPDPESTVEGLREAVPDCHCQHVRGTRCIFAFTEGGGPAQSGRGDAPKLTAALAAVPASLRPDEVARHGVIEYDDHDEWLTETDSEGASRIVARDVPRWFGQLVAARLRIPDTAPSPVLDEGLRVGRAFRYWREFAGLTQRDLADQVGADFTYLSKIENDRDVPGHALVARIDAATGAEGQLIEAWKGTRCPSCGHRLAAPSSVSDGTEDSDAG